MPEKRISLRMQDSTVNELTRLMREELGCTTMNQALVKMIHERSKMNTELEKVGKELMETHRELSQIKVVLRRWSNTQADLKEFLD